MKIDFTDDGNGTLEGDEEELSHIYSQGIAYMMLKGLYNMDDNDAISAFKTYAELHLKIDRPVVGEVGDEWAYWTPGDIK